MDPSWDRELTQIFFTIPKRPRGEPGKDPRAWADSPQSRLLEPIQQIQRWGYPNTIFISIEFYRCILCLEKSWEIDSDHANQSIYSMSITVIYSITLYHIEKISSLCIIFYRFILQDQSLLTAHAVNSSSRLGRSVPCSSDPGRNAGTKGHSLGLAPAVGAAGENSLGSTEMTKQHLAQGPRAQRKSWARWYTIVSSNFNHGWRLCIPSFWAPCGCHHNSPASGEPHKNSHVAEQHHPHHVQMDTPPLPSDLIWRFSSDISN